MDTQENIFVQPVPSSRPGELGFRYHVPLTDLFNKAALTVNETTFEQSIDTLSCAAFVYDKLAGYDLRSFVFKGWENGPLGHLSAIFHRAPTDAELSTPIASMTDTYSIEKDWPNVLVHLAAREDPTLPVVVEIGGSLVEMPRLFEDVYYLPGGRYSCEVTVKTYMSLHTFPKRLLRTNVPVPKLVRWVERNIHGSLECLHSRLTFDTTGQGGDFLPHWGTERQPPRPGRRRHIPATNHVDWKEHCDSAQLTTTPDGQKVLTRRTVKPPDGVSKVFMV